MKLRRSIMLRVFLVTAVSGILGGTTALVVAERILRDAFARQLAPILVDRFGSDGPFARACEAVPASWSVHVERPWQFVGYAYDEASGRSANPAAPPLSAGLLARLPPGPDASAIAMRGPRQGGEMLIRTSAASPCGLVQLQWHNPIVASRVGAMLGAGAVVAALLACGLGLLAIVLPFVRRIRRLRVAAERVGEAGGYTWLSAPQNGDEIDSLAHILDRAHARIRADADRLEERQEALQRHLAHVAHDLRTPLTSLQAALEYAADSTGEPAVLELLAGALRDTVYLAGLTQNLRLASQLRTGWDPKSAVAPVDLADVTVRLATRARMLAKRRRIDLDVSIPDEPVTVACHAVAVEQAFANVVDNAVAYGDPSGHVAVVLTASERERSFELEVSDDGPGVPPSELPNLGLSTFRSDDARRRDPRGSGLGLAITSEVCARLGWTLEFEALEPRGLRVRIRGGVAA